MRSSHGQRLSFLQKDAVGVLFLFLGLAVFARKLVSHGFVTVTPVNVPCRIANRLEQRFAWSFLQASYLSVAARTVTGVEVETICSAKTRTNEEDAPAPLVQRVYKTWRWKNKYDINYRVEGPKDGQPILLVHGFGANVNHFRHQFPALTKKGYRVYAVDLLGFGASDKPKHEGYCIELWVELLTDFCNAFQNRTNQQFIIAGNSIGGLCSLAVCQQLPQLIKGCVLFNCSGGMTGVRHEELPWVLRPILYFFQKVVFGPYFGGKIFEGFKTRENVEGILRQQGVYGDPTNVDEELLDMLLGPSDDDGAQEVFLKVFSGPAGPTPESILPNVECPILAIWGDADPWTPVDKGLHPGNSFGQFAKDFKLVVLPGVGHCPHDECPDTIHEHMLPWMASLNDKLM